MTESEYLACADPARLLEWLQGNHPLLPPCPQPPPSDRKLRLFACACGDHCAGLGINWRTAYGAEGEEIENPALTAGAWADSDHSDDGLATALKAALLREIVGNPLRPPPQVRAFGGLMRVGWLTPAVRGIASRAYDLRDWEALPVLADALQEAGCEDEDVLMHCRGKGRCPGCLGRGGCCNLKDEPGVWGEMHRCALCAGSGWVDAGPLHARGCHVLDLIIGRE
jgi:hypothetical protein